MRRPLGTFAAAAAFLFATSWMASAKAEGSALPDVGFTPLHQTLFSQPTYLSMGAIGSLANPDAPVTLGAEVTLNRTYYGDYLIGPGTGAYLQWEYVAGNQTRASFGSQINFGPFGIETGYAYQTLQENRPHVHSVQIAPFFSIGVAHVGLRVLAPFTSGAPVTCMLVLGLKVPINVGKRFYGSGRNIWMR